jgi:hypothetical protein
MTKRFVSWSDALQAQNFAAIADWFIGYFFAIGALLLILSGIAAGADKGLAAGVRVLLLSSLFAAASTVSGWLLGFLFGVPRTLVRGQTGSIAPDQAQGRSPATSRVNTNLEDISDWLTKTIVGVGLTQLFAVPAFVWKVAGELDGHGFGWEPYGRLLAIGLFFYFAPGGFWLGYVGTRTILARLFAQYEAPTLEKVTPAQDENVKRLSQFIFPDGAERPDKERLDQLNRWRATNNVDAGVGDFINKPEFADARKKAVEDMNVP